MRDESRYIYRCPIILVSAVACQACLWPLGIPFPHHALPVLPPPPYELWYGHHGIGGYHAASLLTNVEKASSICLSVKPSSDWLFSLPSSVDHQVSVRLICEDRPRADVMRRQGWSGGRAGSGRTESRVHLGQGSGRLAQQDGGVGVVLLDGGVRAREERPRMEEGVVSQKLRMRAPGARRAGGPEGRRRR